MREAKYVVDLKSSYLNGRMEQLSNKQVIGFKVMHFEYLESTNDYAAELISKTNPTEGIVVSADFQSKGRGQYGRSWQSQASENITLSVILRPRFLEAKNQFLLNMVASMAISDMVYRHTQAKARVKWPNDVYVEDKKISGILIQNYLHRSFINFSIFGLGINVNQSSFHPDLPNPISMALIAKRRFDVAILREDLFSLLQYYYDMVQSKPAEVKSKYHQQLLGVMKKKTFLIGEQKVAGVIQGVDEIGRLIVNISGKSNAYNHGQINQIID